MTDGSIDAIPSEAWVEPGVLNRVKLILDDDRCRHQVYDEMADQLRSVRWDVPVEPTLPAMFTAPDPDPLAVAKDLLAFDQHSVKALHALRACPKRSINSLMVEMMLLDTTKHIAIPEHTTAHLSR